MPSGGGRAAADAAARRGGARQLRSPASLVSSRRLPGPHPRDRPH